MANIKDVALHAGVSVTTVSHVVNGTRFVSEVARQRVEAAVRELGYVPSAVARSLKHNTTRTFGMVIPNNSNPYFAEIIQGVEARCFAAGYNVSMKMLPIEDMLDKVFAGVNESEAMTKLKELVKDTGEQVSDQQ